MQNDEMQKSAALRLLFNALKESGYEWSPQTPDRLLQFRKNPDPFRPMVQWLGLGLGVATSDLLGDGLTPTVLNLLQKTGFVANEDFDRSRTSMAVSGSGDVFIVHDHWPPKSDVEGGYVHYAAESAWLAAECRRDLEGFIDKRVLDLGCSSGALLTEVAGVARECLGIDISARSIEWARISARANRLNAVRFECARIGDKPAETYVGEKPWDFAIFNPPMVVPSKDAAYPHRDGGALGVELPLVFLDFAWRHLRPGGEVLCFATNPIVAGKPVFFEKLKSSKNMSWEFLEKRCVHSHFNQAVARKQGYSEMGISQIELWYLRLQKTL